MLQLPKSQLATGDRVPNFVLPDARGKFTMFYDEVQGRHTVLVFAAAIQPPMLPGPLAAFEAAAAELASAEIDVFGITLSPKVAVKGLNTKMHLWADPERKISEALLKQLGLGGISMLSGAQGAAVMLDANQRVLAVKTGKGKELAEAALAFFATRPIASGGQVRSANAPVLLMPGLIDPEMGQALISMFEAGNPEEGTVGSVIAGREVKRVLHEKKKRLDYKIEDPEMHKILSQVIGRRIAPELAKAFNFQGFQFDRFLVCRYAADREDRFHMHRDNVSPETADRRFAMTLNINGDEYEGGELVFPEYGRDKYKPGNGGAVIFSCSLLHEALPVTSGVRFALLTFLRTPQAHGHG